MVVVVANKEWGIRRRFSERGVRGFRYGLSQFGSSWDLSREGARKAGKPLQSDVVGNHTKRDSLMWVGSGPGSRVKGPLPGGYVGMGERAQTGGG